MSQKSLEKENTIDPVLKEGICVRCGGCGAICPQGNAISFDEQFYPVVDFKNCIYCGLCAKICPSNDIDIPSLYREIFCLKTVPTKRVGHFLDIYLAHATSEDIRSRASSGGFVTQFLCYLLESKTVDGAIVVSNHHDPLNPTTMLTRSPDDIQGSKGSKYTVIPVNIRLRDLRGYNGKIAFVGLPCHINSLRMWQSLNSQIKDKVDLTIGLFCHRTLEKDALLYLINKVGISPDEITALECRGGEWPGGMRVMLKDSKWRNLHGLTIKEAFNYLSKVFCPDACLNCIDFCSEFADISVGDPWLRGADGKYSFVDARSLVVLRTEKGREYVNRSYEAGYIVSERIPSSLFEINFLSAAKTKTRLAQWRISRLKEKGRRYPVHHLEIPQFRLKERFQNELHNFFKGLLKIGLIRDLYLGFAFSWYGECFSLLKEHVKKEIFYLKIRAQKTRF